MNEQAPIFIVGTGRCGSTLLSTLLRRNPFVLSLSEFLTFLRPYTFAQEWLDGAQFWRLLSLPRPTHTVLLRHGLEVEEFLYPRLPLARHNGEDGIPPLLLTTLPHLSDDPDALYDEIGTVVRAWPAARPATQYLRLFEWLRARFDRQVWVERSGFSLDLVPHLIGHFPTAKFVHLYRDGPECALSMSRHHYFRLAVIGRQIAERLGTDPYDSPGVLAPEDAPAPLRALLPQTFDPAVYRETALRPALFGAVWSALIAKGLAYLAQLPSERVLSISYAALVASPRAELQRLMEFIQPGLAPASWLDEAVTLVRPKPAAWTALPERERRLVERSCRPGARLLCRAAADGLGSVPVRPDNLQSWLSQHRLPLM